MGYWMDNAIDMMGDDDISKAQHFLLDLGYVKCKLARDRANKVLTIVSKANVELAGFGRLLIRIPQSKLAAVMKLCPKIKKGKSYSYCTHSWVSKKTNTLKYATR